MTSLAEVRRLHDLVHTLPEPQTEETGQLTYPEFCTKYLSHRFTDPLSDLHHWIDQTIEDIQQHRGQKICAIAPRGSAKTTRGTTAHALWCVAYQTETYIIIISDSGPQAKQLLANIAAEAETNDELRKDFPGLCGPGPVWRQDELVFPNGVTVGAISTGGKIRGRIKKSRPTLIIVDDPQNIEHIVSSVKRERAWKWLTQDVEYAGEPRTNLLVLGTALHRECIVCQLQGKPGWKSILFKGMVSWPERMDLWKEWENILCAHEDPDKEDKAKQFYRDHFDQMNAGARVLWKERFPLYELMLKRLSTGHAAFMYEQQGEPYDPEACEWPGEYFDWGPGFWFEEWPKELQVKVMFLDPSKGRTSKPGDYQAYVLYGRDKYGYEYVEADLRRQDITAMLATGIELYRQFRPEWFGIEKEAWQELLATPLKTMAQAQNLEIPVYAQSTDGVPKEVRIRRLTPALSQRKMRFKRRSPGTMKLIEQLRDFANGDHEDGCDALEHARRLAIKLLSGGKK